MDPTDDVRVTAGLLASHNPRRGRVVVHPTPAPPRNHVFAHDLLAALGRPISRVDAEHLASAKPAWAAVAAWMLAEQIEDLVVLRADRLPARTWVRLLELRRQTGSRLLFVCHRTGLPNAPAAVLAGVDHQVFYDLPATLDVHDDLTSLGADRRQPAAKDEDDLPRCSAIPGVAHYRAEMFRRLDPAAFARVDAAYLHGFDAACGSLRGHPASGLIGVGQEQLQSMLAEIVRDSPTRRHTVSRLRGAQAGFLAHGLLLTVPAAQDMLDVLSGPGLNTVPVTRWLVDRIRGAVAHPVIAAGLATTLFTGLRPPALLSSRLTVDDDAVRVIHRPTSSRRRPPPGTAGRPGSVITAIFPIPPAARPLLRAADHYTRYALPDTRRLFTPAAMTTEQITAAATACRIVLPDQSADLVAAWQARSACAPIDAAAPHSQSCTHPDWTTSLDTQDHAVMTDARRGGQPPSTPELDHDDPPRTRTQAAHDQHRHRDPPADRRPFHRRPGATTHDP